MKILRNMVLSTNRMLFQMCKDMHWTILRVQKCKIQFDAVHHLQFQVFFRYLYAELFWVNTSANSVTLATMSVLNGSYSITELGHLWLSGVPDFFDRNKILSGGDLSHYQVPHCIRVFFYFVWFVFIHHNFQFYFELCTYCNILDIYLS